MTCAQAPSNNAIFQASSSINFNKTIMTRTFRKGSLGLPFPAISGHVEACWEQNF